MGTRAGAPSCTQLSKRRSHVAAEILTRRRDDCGHSGTWSSSVDSSETGGEAKQLGPEGGPLQKLLEAARKHVMRCSSGGSPVSWIQSGVRPLLAAQVLFAFETRNSSTIDRLPVT